MPPRKPHMKSRAGCIPCKKRHIKCGEERPKCQNCLEYDIECHFLPVTTISVRDSLRVSSSSDPSSENVPGRVTVPAGIGVTPVLGSDDLGVSDLELMHFFSTVTYATMSNVPVEQKLWQTTIVTIGLQHKFLLRGLLAHAAVHLSFLRISPESISYLIKASTHQDIALAQFRKALETITATTFDAVLAFSCLLAIHSIAMAACYATRLQVNEHEHEHDKLAEFLKSIRLLRSVNKLLLPSLSIFSTSAILPLLQITTQHLPEASAYNGQSSLDLLERCCSSHHTAALSNLTSGVLRSSDADRNAIFSETIRELHLAFARTAHPSSTARFTLGIILIWTIVLPEEYMTLVSERDQSAMAVLAHFGALLCGYDDIWWLRGLGSGLIGIIASELGQEWDEVMEWPKAVAEHVEKGQT